MVRLGRDIRHEQWLDVGDLENQCEAYWGRTSQVWNHGATNEGGVIQKPVGGLLAMARPVEIRACRDR
jgi:hypothetical protein